MEIGVTSRNFKAIPGHAGKTRPHMDKFTVIEAVIQQHGARAVFEATFEWEGSDYAPLEAMGFAPTLEDAGRVPYVACIAYIAYHRMSAEERASNYWEGSLALHRVRGEGVVHK